MQCALRALTSMAPRQVVVEAAAAYRKEHSTLIEVHSAGGIDIARRVDAGEAVDIVVLASDAIDKLIAMGKLLSAGRADLMESEIAIGVHTGTRLPDVTDEQALRTLVLEAESVSYSTGPSGKYLEKLFERWGIYGRIRERIVIPTPGIPVAQLIATGEVALGFQQLSELINVPGVQVAGPLPPAVQHITAFCAGITPNCGDIDEALRFVQFTASAALDAIRKRHGMAMVH